MGAKGSTTVEAPDPRAIAQTDAEFNRINQYTPLGSLTFSGPNRNIANMTFAPEVQANLDRQLQSDAQLLDLALGRQEGFESGLPDLAAGLDGVGDFDRAGFESAIFDRGSELLNRQFDRQEDRLRQSLANRGLMATDPELGEAAMSELGLFNQNRDEAFQALALDAIQRAGAEGRAQGQFDIGTQLTDANIREANRARQFNELAALLGLNQVAQPGLNSFFGPAQADVTGAYGLSNQANMHNAQMAQQAQSGLMGGLFGLGSAALGNWDGIFG